MEGAEIDILRSFPFERHTITLLLVEMNPSNVGSRGGIHKVLASHGYKVLCRTPIDILFAHAPSAAAGELASWALPGLSGQQGQGRVQACDDLVLPHSSTCTHARAHHRKTNYFKSGILKANTTSSGGDNRK